MRRVLLVTCLILALGSCRGEEDEEPSVITGTVVSVSSQGLTEVNSFVVASDDERYTVLIDENTVLDFPPAHLNEHRISGEPVRVEVDQRGDQLVARHIEDG